MYRDKIWPIVGLTHAMIATLINDSGLVLVCIYNVKSFINYSYLEPLSCYETLFLQKIYLTRYLMHDYNLRCSNKMPQASFWMWDRCIHHYL